MSNNLTDDIHCFYEISRNKKIFAVCDRNGNYATSPISHLEAVEYLKKRKLYGKPVASDYFVI